jgi:phage terminase small subunit
VRHGGVDQGTYLYTRIVDELAKIGFSDIRKVVSWRSEMVPAEPSEGDENAGTNAIVSRVTVLDSATIDPDAAAAVAQVSQSATGTVQVKMHDKGAALERLARALGMFKDRVDITYDGKPVAPVINLIGCPTPQAVGPVRKG